MNANERENYLIERYGECVTRAKAAQIISKSANTIYHMIKDGRLETVCGGEMVCVHSIARYINSPAEADGEARARKKGYNWHVA